MTRRHACPSGVSGARLECDRPAPAVEDEEAGVPTRRHSQGFELDDSPRILFLGERRHLQRSGNGLVIVDDDALGLGPETERQRGIDHQSRLQGAWFRAGVDHADEDQVIAGRELGRVAIHAAGVETFQRRRRRVGLAQIGHGEGFLDDLQARCRAQGPHDGHARRLQFLFLPDGAGGGLNGDAGGKLASALAVVVEQLAALIHERLLWIVRQADGGLPFRRRVTEIDDSHVGRCGLQGNDGCEQEGEGSEGSAGKSIHRVGQGFRYVCHVRPTHLFG